MNNYLKNILLQSIYSKEVAIQNHNEFLLTKAIVPVISRQACYYGEFKNDIPINDQIAAIRNKVKSLLNAVWVFKEVGLDIILFSKTENIDISKNSLTPDKFGNDAVIVQAIHFINITKDNLISSQSNWGFIKFGYGKRINKILRSINKSDSV